MFKKKLSIAALPLERQLSGLSLGFLPAKDPGDRLFCEDATYDEKELRFLDCVACIVAIPPASQ